jgi:hypothetical protein
MSALDTRVSRSAAAETSPAVLTPFEETAATVSAARRRSSPLTPEWEPEHPETKLFVKRGEGSAGAGLAS